MYSLYYIKIINTRFILRRWWYIYCTPYSKCTAKNVRRTLYDVQYCVRRTLLCKTYIIFVRRKFYGVHYCVLWKSNSVQSTLATVRRTLYAIKCTLCTVQCKSTLYYVHCTTYSVRVYLYSWRCYLRTFLFIDSSRLIYI